MRVRVRLFASLREAVGRSEVELDLAEGATAEGYWPDHDWLPRRDEVFEIAREAGLLIDRGSVCGFLVEVRVLKKRPVARKHAGSVGAAGNGGRSYERAEVGAQ